MAEKDQSKYLQPVDDGLPMRDGQLYALAKLRVVEHYLEMAMIAVKENPWRATYYIDLQAGPGKNKLDSTIALGSPIIALNCPVPFQYYRFNEADHVMAEALRTRVHASPLEKLTVIREEDVNKAVLEVCDEIEKRDSEFLPKIYSCFNIAFLDPEGLEVHWSTVERLASMKRMDLIINFSTGGLNRTYSKLPELGDRYFGTNEWRNVVPENADASVKRRKWIDFYLKRLTNLGYQQQIDDRAEIIAKNSRNVQVYSIIFASKDKLGVDLWKKAVKLAQRAQQPPLF